jgi:hypothetical protein
MEMDKRTARNIWQNTGQFLHYLNWKEYLVLWVLENPAQIIETVGIKWIRLSLQQDCVQAYVMSEEFWRQV